MRADLIIVVDNDLIINLEMFTTFNDKAYLKSKEYIMRIHTVQLHSAEEYSSVKKVEQVNIMEEIKTSKYKIKESLISEEVLIKNKLKTVYYRLDLLPKNAYNIDRFTKWLYFIAADTKEKRDKIAKGDKILMDLNKWLEEYQNDESLRGFFNDEFWRKEIYKEDGRMEGEANKTIEIATNFKKAGIDLKIISENTGLSIDELEKL